MKSCLHVYFSSLGPSHPCLKNFASSFSILNFFLLGSTLFVSFPAKLYLEQVEKAFFSFVILIKTFFIFPTSQPKFRDSDAKDNDGIPFDIESCGATAPNN